MKKLAVVALGGNALLKGNERGTIQQQEKNTFDTCLSLVKLLNEEYNIIITHGNGPQVGNILIRNEAGFNQFKIPKMPLDICVADSQGGIGYMIERQLKNALIKNKIKRNVVTLISQVMVDISDPAFKNPTKPIGTFYLKEEAELLAKVNNWKFEEDPRKRGWRRVVASPEPVEIINKKIIKDLAKKGNIIITAGGGGVPVYLDKDKFYYGVEAVIDKDSASALLAKEVEADAFFILTDVPKVYINFHKQGEKELNEISVEQAESYLNSGEFSAGSMAPKIKAAITFVKESGKEAIITEASRLCDKSAGTKITVN